MTENDRRRRSVRGFLQSCVTGEPRAQDIEDAGLGGELAGAARRWAALVHKAARPAPGARSGQQAAELVDEATDALVEALPADFEPQRENPDELAEAVKERMI